DSDKCKCSEKWGGEDCSLERCKDDFCLNHGKCILEKDRKTCVCDMYYNGDNCDVLIQPKSACENGLIENKFQILGNFFYNRTSHKLECECLNSWYGSSCNHFSCTTNSVCHNGNCNKNNQCNCRPGFTGLDCTMAVCENYRGCTN
ncbi:hypothetical protein HZS_1401, partial [Henneguya salminicola]